MCEYVTLDVRHWKVSRVFALGTGDEDACHGLKLATIHHVRFNQSRRRSQKLVFEEIQQRLLAKDARNILPWPSVGSETLAGTLTSSESKPC